MGHSNRQAAVAGRTRLTLVTPPVGEPLSLNEVKESLVIRHTRHDNRLTRCIRVARVIVESQSGTALINQTWKQVVDRMPHPLELVIIPVVSITSVKYYPIRESATQTTVLASSYILTEDLLMTHTSWPTSRDILGYEIKYVAGHGVDSAAIKADGQASDLVNAMEMIVAYLFENPGDMVQLEATGATDRANLRSLPPEALLAIRSKARYLL